MTTTLALTLTGSTVPTWLTGVTTVRYQDVDNNTGAQYAPLPEGGFDPTTLIVDPRRFVSLRLLTAAELAPFLRETTS
jgi:hypothetical protein